MTDHSSPANAELLALAKYHEKECNRYVNGHCTTMRCVFRGGYVASDADYERAIRGATCEAHETAIALRGSILVGQVRTP